MRARLSRALALLAALSLLAAEAVAEPAPKGSASLRATIESVWPQARQAGVTRKEFDAALLHLVPDPQVVALTKRQPEFQLPVGGYLRKAISKSRIDKGRALLKRWSGTLEKIEQTYGVEPAVIVAIWGVETEFGSSFGDKEVMRSLLTLAHERFRGDFFRNELVDALVVQQVEKLDQHAMRGSWAGAMGQPQFLPSSFRKFAVDFDGDGRRDIWRSVPDTLASIANYLKENGWERGRVWGLPVEMPAGYDLLQSRGEFTQWRERGFAPVRGPMPATGNAVLYHPSGFPGPAFLATRNFDVIKTYNFSDAYALAVGLLADSIKGLPQLEAKWPERVPLPRTDRMLLQKRLAELGFSPGNFEGRMDFDIRDAVRKTQKRFGLTPDGEPTSALLAALASREKAPPASAK